MKCVHGVRIDKPCPDCEYEADCRARNWTEDAGHENGRYSCRCIECGHDFIGHKRRVVCRLCATSPKGNA